MDNVTNKTISVIADKFNLNYLDVVHAFVNECKKNVSIEYNISENNVEVDIHEDAIYLLYSNKKVNINDISISLFTKIKKCTYIALKKISVSLKNNEILKFVNKIVVATIIKVDYNGVIVKYMEYNFYVYNKNFIPSDIIAINYKYKFLVVSLECAIIGMNFTLNRNCIEFIQAIIAANVPEISDNSIFITHHYRISGVKNFISVESNVINNAIALCVGYKGMRIKSIMKDIGGEKIIFVDRNYYTLSYICSMCTGKSFCSETIYVIHDDAEIIDVNIKVTTHITNITVYTSKHSIFTKITKNIKAFNFIKSVYNVSVNVCAINKFEDYMTFIKNTFHIYDESTIKVLYDKLPTIYNFYHFEPSILISLGYNDVCRKILSLMLINIHDVNNDQNIDYIISKNITIDQYKLDKYNETCKN